MTPVQVLLRSMSLDWVPVTKKLPPINTPLVMRAAKCWCANEGDIVSAIFDGNNETGATEKEIKDGSILARIENGGNRSEIYNYLGRVTHWADAPQKG